MMRRDIQCSWTGDLLMSSHPSRAKAPRFRFAVLAFFAFLFGSFLWNQVSAKAIPNLGASPTHVAALNAVAAVAQDSEEEEHGGDLLFHVQSRIQKHSVIYSHEAHLAAGLECADCHDKIFKKEMNGNRFKMSDINKGKACGVCHQAKPPEGVKGAFAPKGNCQLCHTVRVRAPEKK